MAFSQSVVNIGPGQGTIEDWVDNVFFGVRQNIQTGAASIDRIYGDSPVRLPDAYTSNSDDYVNWIWTNNNLAFSWGTGGRLLMEVL